MLISVDDLKIYFKQYNIKTTLTDEELQRLIELQRDSILAQLGVTLEMEKHNYTVYWHDLHIPIVLPLKNVKGIDKILFNGHPLTKHDFIFDELNGVIKIIKHCLHYPVRIDITYYTQLSDLFVERLKSLLMDMVLLLLTPDNSKGIKRIEEGDVEVEYDTTWDWYNNLAKAIPNKLDELKNMLHQDTVYML